MGILIEKNSAVTGTGNNGVERKRINLIEGSGVSITIADGTDSSEAQLTFDASGATARPSIVQSSHNLVVGDVVRDENGTWVLAQGDAPENADVIGIVSAVIDVDSFSLTLAGGYISSGLDVHTGRLHYLDPVVPGNLTETEPTIPGQVRKEVLWADSATSGYVLNSLGVQIEEQATAADIPVADTAANFEGENVETVLEELSDSIPSTASGIPIVDAGNHYTGTNVEAALQEAGAASAPNAVDVPITDAGNHYTGTNVEAALQEVGAAAAPNAADVPIVDVGTYFTGTDVEAALQEVGAASAPHADNVPITDSGSFFVGTEVEAALQELGASIGGGGGGGSGVSMWDYLFTTTGTTVSCYSRSGALVGSGSDLGALVTSVAANYTALYFATGIYPWSGLMDLDGFIGLTMIGGGGLQNENKNSMGGRSGTQFKWTPASGQALTAAGTQGLTVKGIGFQWVTNTYVVGDGTEDGLAFMSIEGIDHSTPTRHAMFQECYFGAASSGKLDCGGPILDVNKTVNIAFINCMFVGGTMNVRGHHVNSTDDFANVVNFSNCRFSRNKAPTVSTAGWASIYGSGNQWAFNGCHWEPSAGGPIYMIDSVIEDRSGLSVADCWVGDQSGTPATGATFITFKGQGLHIKGGQIGLQDGYSLMKILGGNTASIVVEGLNLTGVDAGSSGVIDCSGAAPKGLVLNLTTWPTTNPIINGNVVEPPLTTQVPYFSKTTSYTLKHSDHNRVLGVDATSGAVTITLPSVGCVGCKVTVKKLDSSGNAVTVTRAGSATIDNATTFSLATQYKFVSLVADGTNWNVIGSN